MPLRTAAKQLWKIWVLVESHKLVKKKTMQKKSVRILDGVSQAWYIEWNKISNAVQQAIIQDHSILAVLS